MNTKIKEAALKLFATKGYENTTIREIGKEVGIRGSSIYAHYKSKEEIFLIVVNELFEKITWENSSKTVGKGADFKEVLLNIFKSYYIFFSTHKLDLQLWQRIRFFTPSGMEGKYDTNKLLSKKPIVECYLELFKEGIKTKQLKSVDTGLLVMSFLSFISGFTDSLMIVPYKLTEQQLDTCFELFWDGIREMS